MAGHGRASGVAIGRAELLTPVAASHCPSGLKATESRRSVSTVIGSPNGSPVATCHSRTVPS